MVSVCYCWRGVLLMVVASCGLLLCVDYCYCCGAGLFLFDYCCSFVVRLSLSIVVVWSLFVVC